MFTDTYQDRQGLPIYQGTVFPHFPSTKVQYFLTSHLPRYSISSFPSYQGTLFPHLLSTRVQCFLAVSFVFTDVLSGQTGVSHQPRYSISSQPSLDCIDTLSACQDRLGFPINQGTVFPHSRHWTVLILYQPVRTDWGFPSTRVPWHHFMQSHIRCCVCWDWICCNSLILGLLWCLPVTAYCLLGKQAAAKHTHTKKQTNCKFVYFVCQVWFMYNRLCKIYSVVVLLQVCEWCMSWLVSCFKFTDRNSTACCCQLCDLLTC